MTVDKTFPVTNEMGVPSETRYVAIQAEKVFANFEEVSLIYSKRSKFQEDKGLRTDCETRHLSSKCCPRLGLRLGLETESMTETDSGSFATSWSSVITNLPKKSRFVVVPPFEYEGPTFRVVRRISTRFWPRRAKSSALIGFLNALPQFEDLAAAQSGN